MDEQMSLFDFIENPYETLGEKYTREGLTNVYDRHPDHPCDILVIDHAGNRFRAKAVLSFGEIAFEGSKGYDICWWKEVPEGKPKTKRGDCGTCKWSFWKHGKETVRGCQYHGGKDGCHYEKRKTCRSCSHMRRCTSGLGEIYHGFGCFGFGISKSNSINNDACHDYDPAADGEAWRTSDKAVDEWLDD